MHKFGKTETGYIIPEKIVIRIFMMKFIGSACLKYRTNDSAKKDNAKKGIIIISKKCDQDRGCQKYDHLPAEEK